MSKSISIKPAAVNGLWSVRSNADYHLNDFADRLFRQNIGFGEMISSENHHMFQLWPDAAYLLSDQAELPPSTADFDSMITDISHGFSALNLCGENALAFLNDYSSADISKQQVIRTNIGHYRVVIWWHDSTDVWLLVERSYAHSFTEFLQLLEIRWQ